MTRAWPSIPSPDPRGRLRAARGAHGRLASIPGSARALHGLVRGLRLRACTAWLGRKAWQLQAGAGRCDVLPGGAAARLCTALCEMRGSADCACLLHWPGSVEASPGPSVFDSAASCRLGGRLGQGASGLDAGRPAVTGGPHAHPHAQYNTVLPATARQERQVPSRHHSTTSGPHVQTTLMLTSHTAEPRRNCPDALQNASQHGPTRPLTTTSQLLLQYRHLVAHGVARTTP